MNRFMVLIITILSRFRIRRAPCLIYFYMIAFHVSIYQNWRTLCQEEQAKIDSILMKGLPEQCLGLQEGFYRQLINFISRVFHPSTDVCLEYHKAKLASPYDRAILVKAISMTIAQFFLAPLEICGESLSKFFSGTMAHVPAFAWPYVIGIIVFFSIIAMLIHYGYELHLPNSLIILRPKTNESNNNQQLCIEKCVRNDRPLESNSSVPLPNSRSSSLS